MTEIEPVNTRRAMLQFTAAGLLVLAVVGVLGALVSRAVARSEATDDARRTTATLASAVIAPNLSDDLIARRPDALRVMDAAVGNVTRGSLVRVKIWTPDGRIVYSDEPRLIGGSYPLSADDREALRTGHAYAAVSDLSKPENRFEAGHGKLLEVYQPVRTPSGQPLLFETYSSYRTVTGREHQIWIEFLPVTFGTLLVLQLVQIPLARRMARRLDQSQRERERLMLDALAASDETRRRIAGDLHDGVVQDLVAVSYALTGSAARAGREDHSQVLHDAAGTVRRGIRALRSLTFEIYPPSLRTASLSAALADLVTSVSERGVEINLSVPDEVSASPQAEELIYRTAQEVLRNVLAHAGARQVDLTLQRRGDLLVLTVADDGVGFDPHSTAPGHLGLRLLRDLAVAADASFEVDSAPGGGTRTRLEVPVS